LPFSEGKPSITALLALMYILQASTSPILFVFASELVSDLRFPAVSGRSVAIGYRRLGPVIFGNIADRASFDLFAILNAVVCIAVMLSNLKRKSRLLFHHQGNNSIPALFTRKF
jgi:hypothetical protein